MNRRRRRFEIVALVMGLGLASTSVRAAAQAPVPAAIRDARSAFLVDLTGNTNNKNALYEAIRSRFIVVDKAEDADIAITIGVSDGPTMYFDFGNAWVNGNFVSGSGFSMPITSYYMHLMIHVLGDEPYEIWRDTEEVGLRPHKTAEKLGKRLIEASPTSPPATTPQVSPYMPGIVGNDTSNYLSRAPEGFTDQSPEDVISVGVLPPMPPEWAPPEKLDQSASWTTRDADGVGYQMSVTVGNRNEAPMRAIARIVLREATGDALYSTSVSFLVPSNGTHEEKGVGIVPNVAANGADYWSIDIEWDAESLPISTAAIMPNVPGFAQAQGLTNPVQPGPVLPEFSRISSLLEGTWRSGQKIMEITRIPQVGDPISYTPDNHYFFAAITGGVPYLENYRFEDTSLTALRDSEFTFPGGIVLRWSCQGQIAVTGVDGGSANNALEFGAGASLTLMSNDQIRLESTVPTFISAPGYSLAVDPRPPGDCRTGVLDSTTETRVRTEVWVR